MAMMNPVSLLLELCRSRLIFVLFALLVCSGVPSQAQSEPDNPSPASEMRSPTDAVTQQLIGEWQATDPASGESIQLIFAPDNQLFFILPAQDGSAVAIQVDYQIQTATQPMHLDMALTPDEIALTIFELTPEGKLRLEFKDVTPGQPRPTAFSDTALLLAKTSDDTTVPEDISVIELETSANRSSQAIPMQYISLLNRAQQVYYLENRQFANTLEQLEIATNLETSLYTYEIMPSRDRAESVAITAYPKDEGLPSYIGAVFVTTVDGFETTVSGICQSEKPATSPPPMPIPPSADSTEIQCPAGSRLLQ
ncbi:type IV pilin-like G/H family protein [Coleofasciculus sp. D1-CHI-01]|uniref:type IV pilin-like G/H family protein n=1 Tax=Coleofasciculus sp. D1-CHI-01 TaxID=3068482 RepID=UPI0040640D15